MTQIAVIVGRRLAKKTAADTRPQFVIRRQEKSGTDRIKFDWVVVFDAEVNTAYIESYEKNWYRRGERNMYQREEYTCWSSNDFEVKKLGHLTMIRSIDVSVPDSVLADIRKNCEEYKDENTTVS